MTEDVTDAARRISRALEELFADLPQKHEDRISEILEVRHLFNAKLARVLEPSLNARLHETMGSTIESRRAAASWCNDLLRRTSLAIRCKKTGKPAILVLDAKSHRKGIGRFRLEIREGHRNPLRTLSSTDLPDQLELMEDGPRQEPLSRYRDFPTDNCIDR